MSDIREIFKVWAARNFTGMLHVELGDNLDTWCVMLDGIELVRCTSLDDARETNELVCDFIAEISRRESELNELRAKLADSESRVAKLRQTLVEIGQRSGRTVAEIAAKALKETEADHV